MLSARSFNGLTHYRVSPVQGSARDTQEIACLYKISSKRVGSNQISEFHEQGIGEVQILLT